MISLCESSGPLAEMRLLMGGAVRRVAALNNTLALDVWTELCFDCDHLCGKKAQLHRHLSSETLVSSSLCCKHTGLFEVKQNAGYLHWAMKVLFSVSLRRLQRSPRHNVTCFVADCHFLQQQLGLLHISRLQSKRQHSSSQPLASREHADQQKESSCLYACYQKGKYMLKSAAFFQLTEPLQLKPSEHSAHR